MIDIKKIFTICSVVLIFVVICIISGVIVVRQLSQKTDTSNQPIPETDFLLESDSQAEILTASETELMEETETEQLTEAETETETTIQLEALLPFLEADNRTIDDIPDTQQLIIVQSSGSNAEVYLFEQNSGKWEQILKTSGVVGKNGVSAESREGDYRTPKGIFPLGIAFGTEPLEGLSVEYRQFNSKCYWVDDPESGYYNQWVESDVISWKSAEHLADYPTAYHYAVAINYNMNPVVPYAGSAIFLHCQTGNYTAGCVAVPTNDMLNIFHWLDSSRNPMIWIY